MIAYDVSDLLDEQVPNWILVYTLRHPDQLMWSVRIEHTVKKGKEFTVSDWYRQLVVDEEAYKALIWYQATFRFCHQNGKLELRVGSYIKDEDRHQGERELKPGQVLIATVGEKQVDGEQYFTFSPQPYASLHVRKAKAPSTRVVAWARRRMVAREVAQAKAQAEARWLPA